MQIYLSEKEISALISVAEEWSSIMVDGEETFAFIDEKLDDGLGSALYKLYKGKNGQKIYEEYVKKKKISYRVETTSHSISGMVVLFWHFKALFSLYG